LQPTISRKPGRRGRTISTINIRRLGSIVIARSVEASTINSRVKYRGAALKEYRAVLSVYKLGSANRAADRGLKRRLNVLIKPDRSSTFSSIGVFLSNRNGYIKSASYISKKAVRNSLRGLLLIYKRVKEER
jgi:mannan endo-1,6-alpha-mannosidase